MKYLIAMVFSCLTIGAMAQNKQAFKIWPRVIEQGDDVRINYDPAVNGSAAKKEVKAAVYLFKDFKWLGYDLPLLKTDTGYIASYKVPDGVGMIAYRFAVGDSIDRGTRFPYASVVHAKGKKMEPGSYIEWGLLRSRNAIGEVSPLVDQTSLIEPKVLVQLWISKEFNTLKVKRNLFYDIANGLHAYLPKAKADSIVLKAGAEITALSDVTEKELLAVEKVYRGILNYPQKADSLRAKILAKYPEGLLKRLELIKAIYLAREKDQKIQLWDSFTQAYPFTSFPYADYVDPILGDRAFFSNSYVGIANLTFQKHDLVKLSRLVANAPFQMINYFYDHYVIYPFRLPQSPITEAEALSLSISFTEVMMKRIQSGSLVDRGIFAPSEWIRQEMIQNSGVWAHHIALLYKNKQYDTALKFAEQVKSYVGYKNIDFNTTYAKLLYHFNKNVAGDAYVVEVIKADTASPEIIALLKVSYNKSKAAARKNFDAYYASLRPGAKLKVMQKRLTDAMVKIPAVHFNLKNLSGQGVDLSGQKGKIVVLDFWASWCFPCKAAMPGMQTLVNKYATDQNVAFFFIATLEHDPNYKKLINDFLAAKKYNFNVLYDAEDAATKKMGLTFNDYAKLLKLSGIPQKVVIDKNGFVRWVAGGFNGDLVELTDEVSFIIETLKKEQ